MPHNEKMFTSADIREEMSRLDGLSGLDTKDIPIRISKKMVRAWGKCSIRSGPGKPTQIREVVFSDRLLKHATVDHILDVIRHEYAHIEAALTAKEFGHGPKWKAIAKKYGCPPTTSQSFPEVEDHFLRPCLRVTCLNCGATVSYQRKPKWFKVYKNCGKIMCGVCKSNRLEVSDPNVFILDL